VKGVPAMQNEKKDINWTEIMKKFSHKGKIVDFAENLI
jgi:hypothetical protein